MGPCQTLLVASSIRFPPIGYRFEAWNWKSCGNVQNGPRCNGVKKGRTLESWIALHYRGLKPAQSLLVRAFIYDTGTRDDEGQALIAPPVGLSQRAHKELLRYLSSNDKECTVLEYIGHVRQRAHPVWPVSLWGYLIAVIRVKITKCVLRAPIEPPVVISRSSPSKS